MNLIEQLAKDKTWQQTKSRTNLKSEKLMTKIEYLKSVGHENFTERGYKEYKKQFAPEITDDYETALIKELGGEEIK